MIWYRDLNDGIIISTRVRLARNIDKTPFPSRLTSEQKKEVTEKLKASVFESNSTLSGDFELFELDNIERSQKITMLEEHLISPQMIDAKGCCVMVNKDKTMSIMLMEEDHIRLQIIKGGYCLESAYDLADKVDSVMEETLNYAFDEELGFLTACPTNVGTALRASVMMHLPGLCYSNNASRVLQSFSGMGIAVRGLYGEGTNSEGCMYQISNQITTGLSEKEIIEKLKNVVNKIAGLESQARKILMEKNLQLIEDKLYRSYGILKYARSVTGAEAKKMLSDVMLGQNMGIIECNGKMTPLELMIKTAPSVIMDGQELTPSQRDKKRAELIRENI